MKYCYSLYNKFVSNVKEMDKESFKEWFKRNKEYIKYMVCYVDEICYCYNGKKNYWKSFNRENSESYFEIMVNDREKWNNKYKE